MDKTKMIHNIKPYPKMKDSGVPWLGEVPEHWGINRTKTLFRLRTEKSGIAHDHQLLSIYTHIGVRPRKELQEKGNKASTTDNYWIVKKGDIIANKLLTWMGAIGMSKYNGVTSPAYDILMPIQEIVTEFYHHLFRTSIYRQQFKQYSRGIMDMRLRLYFDQFGQILIPIPPSEDQEQIVRFLNHFDRKIGRYILTKQKLIKLLEEQK
ncbi:MAG: restriction endonuclease subunit S, partial [Candidatus Peregrinibacteria bacterium]|nr:restriction endonuclease subunit S [Candidatus Peregrinibacteria bacterium]